MRLKDIPPFPGRPLEVALASNVSGALHIGAIVSGQGHWMLNGRAIRQFDPCASRGSAGCHVITQVKVLGKFLFCAKTAGYSGDVTVRTADRATEALVNAWRAREKPDLSWYAGDIQRKRRPVVEYPGGLRAVFLSPENDGLVNLAGDLSNLLVKSGQSHEAVEAQARQLLYQGLGIG